MSKVIDRNVQWLIVERLNSTHYTKSYHENEIIKISFYFLSHVSSLNLRFLLGHFQERLADDVEESDCISKSISLYERYP